MKLFGWKSTGRASARPAHLAAPLHPRFAEYGAWPRGFEGQVRELYLSSAIAQRAVRLVAQGVASTSLSASDDDARKLVLATSGGQSLLETLASQLLLHGNGYVQILSGADGRPVELYALRPERVSVEADARGWPAAFRYKAGDAVTRLGSNELIHIRTHHPLDDHYGLGCLDAASGAIAIHNASAKWNKALLDNAARPSGALVSAGGEPMSGEQFTRLKAELAEGFQGAANAGRPMLLEGGLSWQSLSFSPADMDFAGLKAAAAREIALAFGVPPMLLGLPGDATYANYREANKALWRQAILPLADKILAAIAEGLRPWFAGLELTVDLDQVAALSEDRERLWAQLGAADFLTVNEKREAIGLEALNLGEGDEEMEEADREAEAPAETKFNPWHDPDNGQFTFAGRGVNHGAGGGETGETISPTVSMSKPPKGVLKVNPVSGARTMRDGSVLVPLDPPKPFGSYVSDNGRKLIKDHESKRNSPYVPASADKSGVTIGYGYDLGSRKAASVRADLMSVGVDEKTASLLSTAARLTGESAKKFIADLQSPIFLSDQQVDGLFDLELGRRTRSVAEALRVPFKQHQIDALVSLDYNLPVARQKVVRLINQGKPAEAAALFGQYVFGTRKDPKTGKPVKLKLRGLVARREQERRLFLGLPN